MSLRSRKSTPISAVVARIVKRPAPGPTGATPDAKRAPDADIPTPVRRAVVTEVRVLRGSASRLPAGAMQLVVDMFPRWSLKPRWIQNLLKSHDDQVESGVPPIIMMETDLSRNRAGRAPTNAKFTVEIAVADFAMALVQNRPNRPTAGRSDGGSTTRSRRISEKLLFRITLET